MLIYISLLMLVWCCPPMLVCLYLSIKRYNLVLLFFSFSEYSTNLILSCYLSILIDSFLLSVSIRWSILFMYSGFFFFFLRIFYFYALSLSLSTQHSQLRSFILLSTPLSSSFPFLLSFFVLTQMRLFQWIFTLNCFHAVLIQFP